MSPTLIAAAVAATIIGGLAVYAWDADKALLREHDRAEAATMQRDQLQKHVVELTTAIMERNRTLARMGALSEARKRLCAARGPTDACCTPDRECKP